MGLGTLMQRRRHVIRCGRRVQVSDTNQSSICSSSVAMIEVFDRKVEGGERDRTADVIFKQAVLGLGKLRRVESAPSSRAPSPKRRRFDMPLTPSSPPITLTSL